VGLITTTFLHFSLQNKATSQSKTIQKRLGDISIRARTWREDQLTYPSRSFIGDPFTTACRFLEELPSEISRNDTFLCARIDLSHP
jgi:hypothetical protein